MDNWNQNNNGFEPVNNDYNQGNTWTPENNNYNQGNTWTPENNNYNQGSTWNSGNGEYNQVNTWDQGGGNGYGQGNYGWKQPQYQQPQYQQPLYRQPGPRFNPGGYNSYNPDLWEAHQHIPDRCPGKEITGLILSINALFTSGLALLFCWVKYMGALYGISGIIMAVVVFILYYKVMMQAEETTKKIHVAKWLAIVSVAMAIISIILGAVIDTTLGTYHYH